jgi:hypothetical protein
LPWLWHGVAGGAESTDTSGSAAGPINTNTNDTIPAEKTPAKKRAQNMHGIRLKEVPKNAKSTQVRFVLPLSSRKKLSN